MKTTNNVQKAILKSLAVVVSLVLISFTVSAQGFWESLLENTTFNEIALAMVETGMESEEVLPSGSELESDAFVYLMEEEAEEELALEDWMTNDANFGIFVEMETEIEEPMELEDWMTDEDYFAGAELMVETETEEALELEDWMLDSSNFDVAVQKGEVTFKGDYIMGKDFIYHNVIEKEKELGLESWMVNQKIWKN